MPVWVPAEALLQLHALSLARFGGAGGIRDQGGLEAAIVRPQQILAYEPEAGLVRLAAAYAFGLARNHPFIDGNKRAAFLASIVFLELNGLALDAAEHEAFERVTALADGTLSEHDFAIWLDAHLWPAA